MVVDGRKVNLSRRSLLVGCGASLLLSARGESLGPLGLEIYSLRRELAKDISLGEAMGVR
jgi:hypothetical protein